ncbi:exodeoxyribonuclease VII small subunit [Desulfovibrio inopinatus]|uniref:exodeoxyribonuclease VII small subunit n=1 Tax=Desulfovibrio inopinatus TaxID=102109 RepID=UPI00040A42F9
MKNINFEKQLAKLKAIVEQLESGELPLEKGVTLYKQGVSLAASCRQRLDVARLEIEQATVEDVSGQTPDEEDETEIPVYGEGDDRDD